VGGWPGGYLQNALEELNSGLPRTNPNSGRAEDLNQGPPDFKSSALKPFGDAASTMFFYVDWLKIKVFGVIERNRHKHVYSWFPFLPAETLWTSTKQRQTLTTHNTNCCEHFYAYFMGQPLSKQLYMCYWPGVRSRYMGYWPRVRPTWLDVGQVLFFFCLFMDRDGVETIFNQTIFKTDHVWDHSGWCPRCPIQREYWTRNGAVGLVDLS